MIKYTININWTNGTMTCFYYRATSLREAIEKVLGGLNEVRLGRIESIGAGKCA